MKARRSFNRIWKERDSAQPKLLEAILYKDNFNRVYKRVKANKGASGLPYAVTFQKGKSLCGVSLPKKYASPGIFFTVLNPLSQ